MNTTECVGPRVPPHPPAGSVALVPMVGDRGPGVQLTKRTEAGPGVRVAAHVMWYGGLALFVLGAWQEPRNSAGEVWFGFGVLSLLVGGLLGLIYTFWGVSEARLRNALGALGALALTLAAVPRVSDVSREVYATGMIARLQAVGESLARDGRIRDMGVSGEWVALNGYDGRSRTTPQAPTLDEVLRRDGLTRAEFDVYRRGLVGASIAGVYSGDGYALFRPEGRYDTRLLYVLPGRALPPPGALGAEFRAWRSRPMGGGWYLLRAH